MSTINLEKFNKMYINGTWVETNQTMDVINPANDKVIASVFSGGAEEAERAVQAASDAFPAWRAVPAKDRAVILEKIAENILLEIDELALILTTEQGKPIQESKGEITQAADFMKWYAEEGKRVYGRIIPASQKEKRLKSWSEPVGVVGAITPWNFPVSMVTRKIAPALAAGCTVVLKPAEATPLSAIKLFEIFEKSGLPKGVANLVVGDAKEIGGVFLKSKTVKKISFTGSTAVGKYLYKESADTMKRMSLELGGHAPFIVFEDADLDLAVSGLVNNKFRNAGQTCVCTNRVFVHENVQKEFLVALEKAVKNLKVGDGTSPDTTIGPVINEASIAKIEDHVDDAVTKGGNVLLGGKRLDQAGSFFEPTILTDLPKDVKIMREETFGPVLPVWTFKDTAEAIEMANDSDYGLAAYFYTNDLKLSYEVSEQLEYGILGLNDSNPAAAQAPFGGFKQSGLGREGGVEGIEAFLEVKYLSTQI